MKQGSYYYGKVGSFDGRFTSFNIEPVQSTGLCKITIVPVRLQDFRFTVDGCGGDITINRNNGSFMSRVDWSKHYKFDHPEVWAKSLPITIFASADNIQFSEKSQVIEVLSIEEVSPINEQFEKFKEDMKKNHEPKPIVHEPPSSTWISKMFKTTRRP